MFEELWRDDRAIEGLPIRLVIALVVGVASLSVMMSTISGLDAMTVTELDVEPDPEVTAAEESVDLSLTVVDPDGKPVANATVVVRGGTATLESVATAETGADGSVTVDIEPDLGANQAEGTIEISIKPPANGGYTDRRSNTDVLVVRE